MKPAALLLPAAIAITLSMESCDDPDRAALKLFSDQGLTILQPARSYVRAGGLVVLPQRGRPEYLDPLDVVASDDGTYVDFNASSRVRLRINQLARCRPQLTRKSRITSGWCHIQRRPRGAGISNRYEWQAPPYWKGKRLNRRKGDRRRNSPAARAREPCVCRAGNLHSCSMTLTSSSKTTLDASYGAKGTVPGCASVVGPDKTNAKPSTSQTSTQDSVGTSEKNSDAASTSNGKVAQSNATARQKSTTAKPSGVGDGKDKGDQGESVGVCRNTAYSLTFKSKTDIPFAVRLNEIAPQRGDSLSSMAPSNSRHAGQC